MTYHGKIVAVTSRPVGAEVSASSAGATVHVRDASMFDVSGGVLAVEGVEVPYVAADPDGVGDTVTLADPLAVEVGDRLEVRPFKSQTVALVRVWDDAEPVPVVLDMDGRFLPEGVRDDPEAAETVVLEHDGREFRLADVVGTLPDVPASYIDDAEELLLGGQKKLGEALADNEAAILAAQGGLAEAQQALADAFSQIEVLPDEAYVEAAKQQAIDAAEVAAQALANAARTAAEQTAQAALAQAQTDLAAAIASGDAAAIADAEAKIATAKAAAIDAAADDAAAKAAAAQSAAMDAAQDALHQAELDLYEAMDTGDAAAVAEAEAKIATAKQEAITAAANDATAKAGEAMQKANAALTAAQSAQATADNAIRTFYSEEPPWANNTSQPDDVLGDMWYQDSTGQAYRWNGTIWKVIQDASIGEALAAAQDAQTTADGKITAYYQPNEPLEGDEGDLWFDTDDDSAIHRRTGGDWLPLLDPKALADAAEQAAKTAAAADATAKAEAAEAAAAATAAADATAKANQAKADAEAAAAAYADTVSSGASGDALAAAKTYAEQKAADAQAAAEQAAALDATAKAEAAEAAAAATAAADATAKANAAKQAAIDAAALDATAKANQAETNAKAFATTTANGLAKTFWSTSLPGTTQAPQNSTWYRHSGGKIISVFTQTAAGATGSTWAARPITSDAIDNLDVGKLTAAQSVINDQVANTFAAKLANLIEANIGNLTVTGDTHLNSVVAQTIAGDTATFINLAVDQILAGNMQAVWNITAGGKIIAGDPEGARVEMTSTGLSVWVIGYNGLPYEAVALHNGEISFGVTNQDGRRVAGISAEGDVLGIQGSFSGSLTYKGSEVVGQLSDPAGPPGWMDLLPRGILPGRRASTTTTVYRSAGTEAIYLRCRATLYPNRLYRVVGNMDVQGDAEGRLFQRLRMATGGSAATVSSPLLEQWSITSYPNAGMSTRVEDIITVAAITKVEIASSYVGFNGTKARANSGDLYIEDVGARGIDPGGGDGDTPQTTYTTTWKATASRNYSKAGTAISGKDGKIELWYFGSTVAESAGVLFGGVAHQVDDINENGRTLPQALNGATIHRVQLQLTNAMWWNSAHRNVAINTLSSATLPTSKVIDGYTLVKNVPEGATITVDLDPAWFTNGVNRGITLGDKDNTLNGSQIGAGNFQGPNDPDAPLLIITYSR